MTTDQKPQTANDVAKLLQQAVWLHESSFDWPSLVKDTEKKLKARRMLRKAGSNEPESLPTDHLHRYYNKSLSQAVDEVCKDGKESWAGLIYTLLAASFNDAQEWAAALVGTPPALLDSSEFEAQLDSLNKNMASKTRYPYLAFVLDATTRALLLERFLPQHEIVVAHHVTLVAPGKFSEHQPFDPAPKILVYGTAQTPEVDTVAVQVNGNLIRPDGIFYHVTLSHAATARAVQAREAQPNIRLLESSPVLLLTGYVAVLDHYA